MYVRSTVAAAVAAMLAISPLAHGAGAFQWSLVRRNLNQETHGDKRPTN